MNNNTHTLGATEAAAFVAACEAFVAGRFTLGFDDGPRVVEVAA